MPWFHHDAGTIHYSDTGQGTPIMFIHPAILSHVIFQYQIHDLSDAYRVIVPDLRGHGASNYLTTSSPKGWDGRLTMSVIADDIVALLNHLGLDGAYLAGYSIGFMAVLNFLQRFPNRALGGICISGMPCIDDLRIIGEVELALATANPVLVGALGKAIAVGNADNPVTRVVLSRVVRQAHPRAVHSYFQSSLQDSYRGVLPLIHERMLLVYGRRDRLYTKYAEEMAVKLPNSTLRYIDGVSHQIPTKAAASFQRLVRQFLQQ